MRVGDTELTLLSDGAIRLDGGVLYGVVPKETWKHLTPADRSNRVRVGLNCLLIRTKDENILVDTGVGNKHPLRRKNAFAMKAGDLVNDLRTHGLGVEDIGIVALTHLHFDQAGGCTRRGYSDKIVPTFPKATYLVQRQEWHEANHPSERISSTYIPEDFLPLEESGQLELLDGDREIAPDVWLKVTGGHTSGHQILFVGPGDRRVAYLGDVLPTHHHLPVRCVTAWDVRPLDTIEHKRALLEQAEAERWLILFGHGLDVKAGYLVRVDGELALAPQEL
jgi:glyoxylase-like metal-dependent hydrolase (beta-lactamase superfamily II)